MIERVHPDRIVVSSMKLQYFIYAESVRHVRPQLLTKNVSQKDFFFQGFENLAFVYVYTWTLFTLIEIETNTGRLDIEPRVAANGLSTHFPVTTVSPFWSFLSVLVNVNKQTTWKQLSNLLGQYFFLFATFLFCPVVYSNFIQFAQT